MFSCATETHSPLMDSLVFKVNHVRFLSVLFIFTQFSVKPVVHYHYNLVWLNSQDHMSRVLSTNLFWIKAFLPSLWLSFVSSKWKINLQTMMINGLMRVDVRWKKSENDVIISIKTNKGIIFCSSFTPNQWINFIMG